MGLHFFATATQRVHRSASQPSRVELQVPDGLERVPVIAARLGSIMLMPCELACTS